MIATLALAATVLMAAPPSTAPPGGFTETEIESRCTNRTTTGSFRIPGDSMMDDSLVLTLGVTFTLDGAVVGTARSEPIGMFPMMTNRFGIPTPDDIGTYDACSLDTENIAWLDFAPLPRDAQLSMLTCADELRSDSTTISLGGADLVSNQPGSACETLDNMLTLEGSTAATEVGDLLARLELNLVVNTIDGPLAGAVQLDAAETAEAHAQKVELFDSIYRTTELLSAYGA